MTAKKCCWLPAVAAQLARLRAELKECERAVHLHEQQKAKDAKKAAKDARKSAKNLLAGGDGAAPKKSSMCQVL